jgi:hypothetical protein
MPKPITKTTVKLSITHDRLAIKVSYVNGEVLKLSSTRNAARLGLERPVDFKGVKATNTELKILLNAIDKCGPGENNGQMFERVAKVLEGTNGISDAATIIEGHHAQVMMKKV